MRTVFQFGNIRKSDSFGRGIEIVHQNQHTKIRHILQKIQICNVVVTEIQCNHIGAVLQIFAIPVVETRLKLVGQ